MQYKKRRPGGGSGGSGGGGGKRRHKARRPHPPSAPRQNNTVDLESTGYEAAYFRELIDDEVPVVIVLKSGEQLRGQVRYYDRDVFSLGPADGGPKLFLRKSSVRYLYEE